jgi:hypothetical protein
LGNLTLFRDPVLQITNNLIGWVGRAAVAASLVPAPALLVLGRKSSIKQVGDVLPNDWEKLPSMEGPACGDVKVVAVGVGRDQEVVSGCGSVPDMSCQYKP